MDHDNSSNSNSMNNDNVEKASSNNNSGNNDDGLSNELSSMNIDISSSSSSKKKKKKKDTCLHYLKEVEGCSRCSQCRTALYCNRVCQEKHWPVHKNSCVNSNDENSIIKLSKKAENHFNQGNN
jgi:DNA polymerase II small subunit/DNA polymerase delta subunit B